MDLDKFPTQAWPAVWPPEGQPVTPFASVKDPNYQKIVRIIREERVAQLASPARGYAEGGYRGRRCSRGAAARFCLVPEPLPKIFASLDENGFVRLELGVFCEDDRP